MILVGNSRVFYNGKIVVGPAKTSIVLRCVPFLYLLQLILVGLIYCQLFYEDNLPVRNCFFAILHLIMNSCISYVFFCACTTDPGIIARDPEPQLADGVTPAPLLNYHTVDGETMPVKCVCNNCVKGFDHHCMWLNTCVGERNIKYFILVLIINSFLFSFNIIFSLYGLLRITIYLHPLQYNESTQTMLPYIIVSILLFLISFPCINSRTVYKKKIGNIILFSGFIPILIFAFIYVHNFIYALISIISLVLNMPFDTWMISFCLSTFVLYTNNFTIKQRVRGEVNEASPLVQKSMLHPSFKQVYKRISTIIKTPLSPPYTQYDHHIRGENRPFRLLKEGSYEIACT
ncbi:hypothetical protein WA158_001912 [Blastocystis sp. Blastoise]